MVEDKSGDPMKDPTAYFTPTQMDDIIDACGCERDRVLLMLLSRTGRRISEVVRQLKPIDIRSDIGQINFTILKQRNDIKKMLAVDISTMERLLDYIKNEDIGMEDFVFPISRQRVDKIIKNAAKKIGLETLGESKENKIHAHLFRHSFAIKAAMDAKRIEDIVRIKKMLGHSRMDTTMFYLNFNPEGDRELLERMWKKKET